MWAISENRRLVGLTVSPVGTPTPEPRSVSRQSKGRDAIVLVLSGCFQAIHEDFTSASLAHEWASAPTATWYRRSVCGRMTESRLASSKWNRVSEPYKTWLELPFIDTVYQSYGASTVCDSPC